MSINVMLDRVPTPIDRGVFEALFEQSVVRSYAPITKAMDNGSISFRDLVKHARMAEIPYPLFFAPRDVVDEQLRIKQKRLLEGFSAKREFSMNSRHHVDLAQVELIVKNIQFKQDWMKKDKTLDRNPIVGMLKKSKAPIAEDAARLREALQLGATELRGAKNKGDALGLLVDRLEAQNILVAQSVQDLMPQRLPKGKIFSGMTVKDAKLPFIFIASGDEGEAFEPTGRRIFTLMLMAVLVARGRFATVTYNGHTAEEKSKREYELAAEILMPESDFRRADLSDLEAITAASNVFQVTPSAVVMRAQRLKLLTRDEAEEHLAALKDAFDKIEKTPRNRMLPMNALRKFNGHECSRRMLALYDSGTIKTGDFCRVMFSNAYRSDRAISDYRAGL
ncbi:ImmA/IrrE family metallo-endopeptidase [Nocardioides albidus]|uniref:ImmA/IrrE family metallo-endopeptidase n=1 Tax=Nocardioides albidus TaxID=1517589 RepID=A0A5C4W0V6_9ACTN|nr:ImmA/IrrE family metallo-endopeptidase [Nocardioides albidus]TNM41135.1 ImmA/IrrE family metallo-endopeptidase [Nocardioides albidus]